MTLPKENKPSMHHKSVQAIVRYMRSQKVESFRFDGLEVKFSPDAFDDSASLPPSTTQLDPYASDDERSENLRGR